MNKKRQQNSEESKKVNELKALALMWMGLIMIYTMVGIIKFYHKYLFCVTW